MTSPKLTLRPLGCLMCLALLAVACDPGSGLDNNNNGADDAGVTADASAEADGGPGPDGGSGGSIAIYLTGDATPKSFTDGLVGQTPTDYVIAISKYWVQTTQGASPVLCYDLGGAAVEADLSQDTLMGICDTATIPTATYNYGRVKVEWIRYTVSGIIHASGQSLPGDFTFFRAYSDTEVGGDSFVAGDGTVTFVGLTTMTVPYTFPPIPVLPGLVQETVAGEYFLTFPYLRPLVVDQASPAAHWARMNWEIYEAFRWTDATTLDFVADEWDVDAQVTGTEPVSVAGVTGYYVTSSED